MDPQFFDRINALQNFQNQQANRANLQQLQANQAELAALREQLAEEANKPQCPHCGGPSEKGFDRCKNCGQEVIWCGHFVGKPSDRSKLNMAMQQYELGIKRQQKLEMARQQAAKLKEKKEWEAEHPGHKFADRAKVEAAADKVSEGCVRGCGIIILLAALAFIGWFIFFAESEAERNQRLFGRPTAIDPEALEELRQFNERERVRRESY